jgi:hypothetical protein
MTKNTQPTVSTGSQFGLTVFFKNHVTGWAFWRLFGRTGKTTTISARPKCSTLRGVYHTTVGLTRGDTRAILIAIS